MLITSSFPPNKNLFSICKICTVCYTERELEFSSLTDPPPPFLHLAYNKAMKEYYIKAEDPHKLYFKIINHSNFIQASWFVLSCSSLNFHSFLKFYNSQILKDKDWFVKSVRAVHV